MEKQVLISAEKRGWEVHIIGKGSHYYFDRMQDLQAFLSDYFEHEEDNQGS